MKYYSQKALFPVIYLVLTAITAFAGLSFSENLYWLKIVIGVVDLGLYTYFIAYYAFKTGEEAMTVRFGNDITRKEIIRTGSDLKLKITEEYKVWKGFLIGLIACLPLLLLWIIHLTIVLITGKEANQVGGITILLYMVVIYFFNLNLAKNSSPNTFYLTAIYVPYIVIIFGIFYILGAKKTYKQKEIATERLNEIYGDDKQ